MYNGDHAVELADRFRDSSLEDYFCQPEINTFVWCEVCPDKPALLQKKHRNKCNKCGNLGVQMKHIKKYRPRQLLRQNAITFCEQQVLLRLAA